MVQVNVLKPRDHGSGTFDNDIPYGLFYKNYALLYFETRHISPMLSIIITV